MNSNKQDIDKIFTIIKKKNFGSSDAKDKIIVKVPVPESEEEGVEGDADVAAASFWKGALFPLSYIGLGMKLSRFGLEKKVSSTGALVVFWSAQALVGNVYECLEALMFR